MSKKKLKDVSLDKKILILSILILFIILTVFLLFFKYKEKGYKIKNIINSNPQLSSKHCLDTICIDELKIFYYKDQISSISGYIINEGTTRGDACVKIKFILPGKEETVDYNTCYYDLGVDEKVPLETYFNEDKKDLVQATDYKLEYLSDEELKQLYDAKEKDENN